MVGALAVLAVVVLVVARVSRGCTFSPGGPTVDAGSLPVVDAPAELRELAPHVEFPVRIPAVPAQWRANSLDRDTVGEVTAVRTGFVTPEGRYLRLLQSDAPEAALLAVEAGTDPVPGRGVVDVDGQQWGAYGRDGQEPTWIADLGDVRLLITGSGSEADFRTLAVAAVTGEVLG